MKDDVTSINNEYKYGFAKPDTSTYKTRKGLSREVIQEISRMKSEPQWMLERRLQAFELFEAKPMPQWGGNLNDIDFDEITYFNRPADKQASNWDELPADILDTYNKIGIPQAEQKYLAGVGAQYDSEVVYHSLKKQWEDKGVIFLDTDTALKQYPHFFEEYFGKLIPAADNKFAALNTAVWSGGSFVYVPPGVHLDIPLQAYFRINVAQSGQFERTLIIADEGSFVHYAEGCTAPIYAKDSLHAAVVEIVVKKGARVRYTTIQNWSKNVYNLVTKRAFAYEDATMEWVDGNLGCLAEGSTVTTPSGIKAIQDIKVGDKVLSYDEQLGELCFRTVKAKKYSGMQKVRKITSGQRSLYATDNHPFYSYTYNPLMPRKLGRYAFSYVRADQLEKAIMPISSLDYGRPHELTKPSLSVSFENKNQYGRGYKATRTRISRLRLPTHTNDQLMWLFGYWIGDGNTDVKMAQSEGVMRYASIGFSTPRSDRARPKVMRAMAEVIDSSPYERADGHHLAWHSTELVSLFQLNGFSGRASQKRVPEWIWSVPESQRLSFIAGYLDADGTVISSKRRFSIKSCNKKLLEDIASLLVTLGVSSQLYTEYDSPRQKVIMGVYCNTRGSFHLEFFDSRFLAFVSAPMQRSVRQFAGYRNIQHRLVGRSSLALSPKVEVARVKVSDPQAHPLPTWDIEVDGTGNFISQGFIVHNSKLTMKYPSIYLMEPGAKGDILSLAFANKDQHQDAGGKVIHLAPHTTSAITSKSLSKNGGRSSYRGLVHIPSGSAGSKCIVRCDALLLDEDSRSDTYPTMKIHESDVSVAHEATVSKIGEDQLFYLMSRGLDQAEAESMIVNGFVEPIVKELPLEYAIEMNRLIQMEMEGSVG